ncbi:hypothetical protein [Melittangium boletus]|uniref:Lipoprotein n=1 Tax=Melittangium boletus DSM 14713 TaxID=1294270 RepID=A0A250IEP8_9BACT|nr:hypothetical protein [Melittangium boletus]ATB29617.1 hypothetical protein MEBOL_003072 [Melittangium boletus DSM 14713]
MRRLVCAVAVSIGMLMGCGGAAELDTPEMLDTVEQGLACAYPDMSCPAASICADNDMCRPRCPSSGLCNNGSACRTAANGNAYCP